MTLIKKFAFLNLPFEKGAIDEVNRFLDSRPNQKAFPDPKCKDDEKQSDEHNGGDVVKPNVCSASLHVLVSFEPFSRGTRCVKKNK